MIAFLFFCLHGFYDYVVVFTMQRFYSMSCYWYIYVCMMSALESMVSLEAASLSPWIEVRSVHHTLPNSTNSFCHLGDLLGAIVVVVKPNRKFGVYENIKLNR